MTAAAPAGTLLLVPNTLDHGAPASVALETVLPLGVLQRVANLDHWVVENAKTTRAFLNRVHRLVPLARPLQEIEIAELPSPPKGQRAARGADVSALLAPLLAGHDLGLLSEAGMPAVADPGAAIVAAAHDAGYAVVPLVGPSALLLAVAAGGLNGQSFAFVGYVPSDTAPRTARLRELEAESRRLRQAQWLIETPYRNAALFAALLQTLAPTTRLSVACGLTMEQGWTRSAEIAQWRQRSIKFEAGLPAMFGLQAA